jgi:ribokinase
VSGAPVVVLGDVKTDVVARIDGPLAHASDTPARIVMRPGGSAANTAAWLGRLGVPVVMAGCVGDDAPGREARAALEAECVVAALAVAPGLATGACIVLVERDGERTMLPDAGANAALPVAPLPDCAHLHVSGYALIREGSRGAARAALAAAAAIGATTSVDPASAAPLAALARPRSRRSSRASGRCSRPSTRPRC